MMQAIDNFFVSLSEQLDIPDDQLRLVSCWIMAQPIGFLNHFVRNPLHRQLYSLLWGLFFNYILLKEWVLFNFSVAVATYVIILLYKKKSGWPVFMFSFGVMTICHGYRYFTDFYGWKMDFSISLQMMVCKLTYIGFHLSLGKLEKVPSFFDYIAYLYFYPTANMGPTHTYQIYDDFINLRGNYVDMPFGFLSCFKELLWGIFYLAIYKFVFPIYAPEYFWTEEFRQSSFFYKIYFTHINTVLVRCRYYGAWKLGQASINAAGISYNGLDENKKSKFDKIIVYRDNYEISINPKIKTVDWHTNVQKWLKDAVHAAFYDHFKSNTKAIISVFFVSGLWHGIHPAYFIGFAYWGFLNAIYKCIENEWDLFKNIPYPIRYAMGYVAINISIFSIGLPIYLMDMPRIMEIYKELYYIPLVGLPIILLLCRITGFGKKRRGPKPDNKQKETVKPQQQQQNTNENKKDL